MNNRQVLISHKTTNQQPLYCLYIKNDNFSSSCYLELLLVMVTWSTWRTKYIHDFLLETIRNYLICFHNFIYVSLRGLSLFQFPNLFCLPFFFPDLAFFFFSIFLSFFVCLFLCLLCFFLSLCLITLHILILRFGYV